MKIAILGYGNLGKGVEAAIKHNPDAELTAIFTRRDPSAVKPLTAGVNVYNVKDILAHKDEIDGRCPHNQLRSPWSAAGPFLLHCHILPLAGGSLRCGCSGIVRRKCYRFA